MSGAETSEPWCPEPAPEDERDGEHEPRCRCGHYAHGGNCWALGCGCARYEAEVDGDD